MAFNLFFFLERFRSIAKSYFRRADGVLLLYDVTCEKSFLNVREWVDMIEVRTLKLAKCACSSVPAIFTGYSNVLCCLFSLVPRAEEIWCKDHWG